MTRIAYLDIIGGISGDMLISAMLDAGLDLNEWLAELAKIIPQGFHIEQSKTSRGAINATHINVVLNGEAAQRVQWDDFDACIEQCDLPKGDVSKVLSVFDLLKQAEADAHGVPTATSHLHELGSFDTLVDIAGAVIGLRLLGVYDLRSSPIPASVGMASSSHGRTASFAPATISIIKSSQIPVKVSGPNQPAGESITPTGAAIVATLAKFAPANMRIDAVAYGAGSRNTDTPPNVVGLWLGERVDAETSFDETANSIGLEPQADTVIIETNLDDMTGEELGRAMQKLFDAGALDVWVTPIQMKKSRPGSLLSAICHRSAFNAVAAAFFTHTTTLGVRVRQLDRLVANREFVTVETAYGPIAAKLRRVGGTVTQVAPEYDECAKLASKFDVPLRQVMEAAKAAYKNTN